MTRIPQPSRDAAATEWQVYADALQEANDPRGELIALNLAVAKGMAPADRDAYVARHADALYGSAAPYVGSVTWVGCIPDRVELRVKHGHDMRSVIAAYCDSGLATARALSLVGVPEGGTALDVAPAIARLVDKWPADLAELALIDDRAANTAMLASRDFDPPTNLVAFGSLAPLWAKLESLALVVADSHQLELGEIDAPKLTSFSLRCLRYGTTYGDAAPISAALASAKLPKLTSLDLHLPEEFMANIVDDSDAYISYYANDENYEDRMDEAESDGEQYDNVNWEAQLAPVFENLKSTPLQKLGLHSFENAESLLSTLAAGGLPPKLVELDLSESSINGVEWFEQNAALLHQLKRLALRDTRISDDDAKRLAKLGPEIAHSSGSGSRYRYIVGSE